MEPSVILLVTVLGSYQRDHKNHLHTYFLQLFLILFVSVLGWSQMVNFLSLYWTICNSLGISSGMLSKGPQKPLACILSSTFLDLSVIIFVLVLGWSQRNNFYSLCELSVILFVITSRMLSMEPRAITWTSTFVTHYSSWSPSGWLTKTLWGSWSESKVLR